MSTNISKIKREKLLTNLQLIKEGIRTSNEWGKLSVFIDEIDLELRKQKYGLVFEEHLETIDEILEKHVPVFVEQKELKCGKNGTHNFLIEGDNLSALKLLEKTHRNKIDLVYIDPPYNRGDKDFIYDDEYVDTEDAFRHSKWLSFMKKRLIASKKVMKNSGVIIIHIDENEVFNLVALMHEIFGETNDLGMIIWNKMNPKGDAKGVSAMHEYVLCYAKNKETFLNLSQTCIRRKPNAEKMIKKANSLYKKIGRKVIPEEIKDVMKPYGFSKNILSQFEVEYTLDLVNREFQNWLNKQNFSSGEKAYKYIDSNGEVYRGVSMAWPNKKMAPEDYFKPLIHPLTGKECPVPHRGWRNPSKTMELLLEKGLILFGEDERKQPERKYLLRENMLENTPSIYESASSDDKFFIENELSFEYAKPVDVLKYFISSIHPDNSIILDFFAGSGSTAHAVMDLNKEFNENRQFILVTNNENNICRDVTYKRLKTVIEKNNYDAILNYYKLEYIETYEKLYYEYSDELLTNIDELIKIENYIFNNDEQKYKYVSSEEDLETIIEQIVDQESVKKIFISNDILINLDQEEALRQLNIEVSIVPDYYYRELRG